MVATLGYSWVGFVLEHGSQSICFEIKSSSALKVTQGSRNAVQNLKPTATIIVTHVDKRYAFSEQLEVIALADITSALQG